MNVLRKAVDDCKILLTRGLSEQRLRDLWVKKKKFELALEMLDRLEALRVLFSHLFFSLRFYFEGFCG